MRDKDSYCDVCTAIDNSYFIRDTRIHTMALIYAIVGQLPLLKRYFHVIFF